MRIGPLELIMLRFILGLIGVGVVALIRRFLR